MRYTLITSKGKIMQFFIREVAELYQTINGGVIVDQLEEIVDNTVIV